ncbi:MAG TPA: M28 family peptidase [Bacteroidales bacterium]|nr:M28 family peptidase [Bacteroidales bacterium]
MKKIIWLFLLLVSVGAIKAFAQSFPMNDSDAALRIQKDICILANDSMSGRETGTIGEWIARKYIEKKFKETGLKPLFDTSYFQTFTYSDLDFVGHGTAMEINGKELQIYKDYFPIGFSVSDTVSGKMVFAGTGIFCDIAGIDDYRNVENLKGKIAVLDLAVPDALLKNKKVADSTQKVVRVKRAISHGAVAVIFISSDTGYGMPSKDPNFYKERVSVPVVYVVKKDLINIHAPGKATIMTDIGRSGQRMAHNVGGIIDNGAPFTVVIGAHYDHIGLGFFGARDPENNEVHNGADDNASGVAGMLELARRLSVSDLKKNNYIFLAFSGEEKGLIGSSRFIDEGGYPRDKLNYVINLDMIGRLDSKKHIKIYGSGTSDMWDEAINKIDLLGMEIEKIKTGIGGSDHTSFNQKEIPAIFLHTGLHSDYHKAVDDCGLINTPGANEVVKFAHNIINYLDDKGKIKFKIATLLDEIIK